MADYRDLCERCVVRREQMSLGLPPCEKACFAAAQWELRESLRELGQAIMRELRLSWRVIKTMFGKEAK